MAGWYEPQLSSRRTTCKFIGSSTSDAVLSSEPTRRVDYYIDAREVVTRSPWHGCVNTGVPRCIRHMRIERCHISTLDTDRQQPVPR